MSRGARRPRLPGPRPALLVLALGLASSCAPRVQDPREAATAFARAAAQGDADGLYAMLSPAARATLSRDDLRRLVTDERAELEGAARALTSGPLRAKATARLRFADGEEVALDGAGGAFGVTSAGAIPGGAPTPEAALDELRRAIARRSYGGVLRLLAPATRAAIEQDLRSLVRGLEHAETLPVRATGDSAVVSVPGGHHVALKREAGVWRVEDFD